MSTLLHSAWFLDSRTSTLVSGTKGFNPVNAKVFPFQNFTIHGV